MKGLQSSLRTPTATVGVGRWRRFVARFDWPLFIAFGLILAIGLLNLYSATSRTDNEVIDHSAKFDQQIVWIALGFGVFFATTMLDYRNLTRIAWLALGAVIITMVAVFILGQAHKGAQRWIGLGFVRVQPSELVKLAVIVAMARFVQKSAVEGLTIREQAVRWAAILTPVILVAAQPDLGSGILVYVIILSVGFLTMRNLWPLIVGSLITLAMLPVVWDTMRDYQQQRIKCFLDPSDDKCWHMQQSIYAIGSGKVIGKGFMEGTQNRYEFVAEQWTDFPFAVWGEEWGFLGAIVLLLLYGFLIFWIVNVALMSRDRFGSAICIGVAAMFFWHVVVNIAMVLGMAPVVGVTLPLISYGGSSIVTFFLALGLVSSVSMRRHGF